MTSIWLIKGSLGRSSPLQVSKYQQNLSPTKIPPRKFNIFTPEKNDLDLIRKGLSSKNHFSGAMLSFGGWVFLTWKISTSFIRTKSRLYLLLLEGVMVFRWILFSMMGVMASWVASSRILTEWWFQICLFSPRLGDMIQFDY